MLLLLLLLWFGVRMTRLRLRKLRRVVSCPGGRCRIPRPLVIKRLGVIALLLLFFWGGLVIPSGGVRVYLTLYLVFPVTPSLGPTFCFLRVSRRELRSKLLSQRAFNRKGVFLLRLWVVSLNAMIGTL